MDVFFISKTAIFAEFTQDILSLKNTRRGIRFLDEMEETLNLSKNLYEARSSIDFEKGFQLNEEIIKFLEAKESRVDYLKTFLCWRERWNKASAEAIITEVLFIDL